MGTIDGGHKTAAKNTKKDHRFYSKIGRKGGQTQTAKTKFRGFGSNPDLASRAGKIGGAMSRRSALVAA